MTNDDAVAPGGLQTAIDAGANENGPAAARRGSVRNEPPSSGTIPAITLWQPWATWIALGLKTIETRGHSRFRCLVGQRIAIHAGMQFDWEARETAAPFLIRERLDTFWSACFPRGFIVATAIVEEARWLQDADSAAALCWCDATRFGLFLTDVRRIDPPIRVKGKMGIWSVPTAKFAGREWQ